MEFSGFIEKLTARLKGPLPGLTAQLKMATVNRAIRNGMLVIPDDARKGAVLVLFYPVDTAVSMVLIKRTEYPGVHSGQISFPGGSWEAGDVDMAATATRETEEEIGVSRKSICTIGKLTDLFIPPSNFLVTPVVGYLPERPSFHPDPAEVDNILEVTMEELMDRDTRKEKEIIIKPSLELTVPCFYINGHVVWGATAMIINELLELLSQGS